MDTLPALYASVALWALLVVLALAVALVPSAPRERRAVALDRYEALALVRSVRGWSGMLGARRLSHALDALVLASGLVGSGSPGASAIPGSGHAIAKGRLDAAGPVLLEGLTGWPCATGVAALGWARDALAALAPCEGLAVAVVAGVHADSLRPTADAGQSGGAA